MVNRNCKNGLDKRTTVTGAVYVGRLLMRVIGPRVVSSNKLNYRVVAV